MNQSKNKKHTLKTDQRSITSERTCRAAPYSEQLDHRRIIQCPHLGSDMSAACLTRPKYVLRSYCETGSSRLPGSEADIAFVAVTTLAQKWLNGQPMSQEMKTRVSQSELLTRLVASARPRYSVAPGGEMIIRYLLVDYKNTRASSDLASRNGETEIGFEILVIFSHHFTLLHYSIIYHMMSVFIRSHLYPQQTIARLTVAKALTEWFLADLTSRHPVQSNAAAITHGIT